MTDPEAVARAVREETGKVLIGNEDVLDGLTVALLTRSHVLLEGVPGVAKTTMANLFARATGLDYNRIQMTPDVLPADVTGTHVYREATGGFDLQRGPVFSNVVVADEINRATPKTQSALLEAMQERRVTIEGDTHDLPDPFAVIATQNPIEMEGSLLPEETLLADGRLWRAEEALEHAREHGELLYETDDSRTYAADLTTQTIDETGTVEPTDCYLYETEYDGERYDVRTRSGREISVSGNHPFLVNRDGNVRWVVASDLDAGDHLVAPSRLDIESEPFVSHDAVLETLESRYTTARREVVLDALDRLERGADVSRADVDRLRIASDLSKKELAGRLGSTYDQVCNFLDGADNPVGDEAASGLRPDEVRPADWFESHTRHGFDRGPTDEEAGFLLGFVLSDGRLADDHVGITQKNLPDRFDRWVDLVSDLGLDANVFEEGNGVRQATVHSKPFADYLRERYHADEPTRLLSAPPAFRRAFLEIFLLAESQFDAERRRITFVQKDPGKTNLVAYLLLQHGIRPWITRHEGRFEIRIQGEDLATYLGPFTWHGEEPDVDSFEGVHRTVPVSGERADRIVENLGIRFEGEMAEEPWYNGYDYARTDGGPVTERSLTEFVTGMRERIDDRSDIDVRALARENPSEAAKRCGLAMTDLVDATEHTEYRIWQAYQNEGTPDDVVDYIAETFDERIDEAERLTEQLSTLVEGDALFDPVVSIDSEPYEGTVIGLSVPGTHNYVAGLGACGINHNTFELPEAQRDRFQFRFVVDLPDRETESELLDRFDADPDLGPADVEQVVTPEDIIAAREAVRGTYVSDAVKGYILDLVVGTRESPDTEHGASPRAAIAFLNASKARAAIDGREYVIPDDVKALAEPVLAHRLVLSTDAELGDVSPSEVVREVVASVTPPGGEEPEAGPGSDTRTEEPDTGSEAVGDGGDPVGVGDEDEP